MVTASDLIRSDQLAAARLVELEFPAETERVWSGNGSLTTLDGRVWKGVGGLGRISAIRETEGLAANKVVIGIQRAADGVELDPVAFAAAVNVERNLDVYNRAVRIYLQVFEVADYKLVGNPETEFIGFMSHIVTRREGTQVVTINIHCESMFTEGRKPAHIHYTAADQEARFPGDKGFEFIAINVDRILVWPRD